MKDMIVLAEELLTLVREAKSRSLKNSFETDKMIEKALFHAKHDVGYINEYDADGLEVSLNEEDFSKMDSWDFYHNDDAWCMFFDLDFGNLDDIDEIPPIRVKNVDIDGQLWDFTVVVKELDWDPDSHKKFVAGVDVIDRVKV